jgi:hypothetical protein
LFVLESQHTDAVRLQKFCPLDIACGLRRFAMNATVQLDGKLMFHAKEIQDKAIVRMLSSKLETRQATASQRFPQLVFSKRWLLALLACRADDGR